MHYYTFKPKDYMSKTAFLEPLEDLAYRRMLDYCYLTEKPLPKDIEEIAMLICMRTHTDSIKTVLRYFFDLTDDGYVNDFVVRELDAYHSKSAKAKASANARWSKERNKIKGIDDTKSQCNSNANALHEESECNANQEPITNNQEPILKEKKFSFRDELISLGGEKDLVSDYIKHRKEKKASLLKTGFNGFKRELDKSGLDVNTVMRICIDRAWRGFDSDWLSSVNISNYQQPQIVDQHQESIEMELVEF